MLASGARKGDEKINSYSIIIPKRYPIKPQ